MITSTAREATIESHPVRFESPTTLPAALALLQEPGARCLAGGQSLAAAMNAHLLEPELLVSLRLIPELQTITERPGQALRIGAMVTHRALATLPIISGTTDLLARAVPLIAHPAIRQQATIGGALCQADPAGDLPTVAICAGATLRIANQAGIRECPADQFDLKPGDLLLSIDLPGTPPGTAAHYEKLMRSEGDFATVSVAAMIGWADSECSFARLAIGGCGPAPIHLETADHMLIGTQLDDIALRRAGAALAAACDPVDDTRASRDYRLKLIPRLLARAALAAKSRAEAALCTTT